MNAMQRVLEGTRFNVAKKIIITGEKVESKRTHAHTAQHRLPVTGQVG